MKAKPITQAYIIPAPVAKVFKAFIDAKTIARWSKDAAVFSKRAGGTFSLWGGSIAGVNKKIVRNKLIVQSWRILDTPWKKASTVMFVFFPEGKKTRVALVHSGFPAKERRKLALGWRRYYLGAIQKLLVQKPRRRR